MVQENPGSPLKNKHSPCSGSQLFHQFIPSIPHNNKQVRNTWHDNFKNNQKTTGKQDPPKPLPTKKRHRNPSRHHGWFTWCLLGRKLTGNRTSMFQGPEHGRLEITQSSGYDFFIPNNNNFWKCHSNRNQVMIHLKLLDSYFFCLPLFVQDCTNNLHSIHASKAHWWSCTRLLPSKALQKPRDSTKRSGKSSVIYFTWKTTSKSTVEDC